MCGASDRKDAVGFPLEQEKERVHQRESGSPAPALHKRGLNFPFCSFHFNSFILPAFLIAPTRIVSVGYHLHLSDPARTLLGFLVVMIGLRSRWGFGPWFLAGSVGFLGLWCGNAAESVSFEAQVAPILVNRCLECHSGSDPEGGLDLSQRTSALAGGSEGPVILPGDPEGSRLWQLIATDEMPPEHPLPEAERERVRTWIAEGADWNLERLSRFGATSEARAGLDWWSLQPVTRPPVPELIAADGAAAVENPIDLFVAERRSEAGLTAAPEASRLVLIRRLYFDLLGLPPEPETVEAFVNDAAPNAYERLVDSVLASPAFGERWARHWLDVARFGESQGFERDHIRLHSWRYRDWVVDAFNANVPYDEFARLQLAGDVLPDRGDPGVVATGFLVGGAYDIVGQTQQSAAMRAVVRQDEMEDYVSTVGQAFLGLTVHCARCHDHKFDPILQREYYQLSAALAGVRPKDRSVSVLPEGFRQRGHRRALEGLLRAEAGPIREAIVRERLERGPIASAPLASAAWDSDAGRDSSESVSLRLPAKRAWREFSLELSLRGALEKGEPRALVSWRRVGVSEADVLLMGGAMGNELYLSRGQEKNPRRLAAIPAGAWEKEGWNLILAFGSDKRVQVYVDGQPVGKPVLWRDSIMKASGDYELLGDAARESLTWTGLRCYEWALGPAEAAAAVGVVSRFVSEQAIQGVMNEADLELRRGRLFELEQLQLEERRVLTGSVYAVAPREPGVVHVLKRGNPATPAEPVAPAGIASLAGVAGDFGLSRDASDGERRRSLAAWITGPANPLFARVMVNRLWQYHFGAGLVATPSDFGFNGGRPSHPELLDWLASELVARDWDLKAMHRLMVTSATYRQASLPRAEGLARDAGNRWLWRMTPRRLEAELLRDAMLQVTGLLNATVGGPGFQDFTTYVHNSQFYEMQDPVGATFQRRSLYRMWIRSGRSPFLDVFDCPDPSATAPKRAVTTTPLQALTLLNHSFALRMSEALAERMVAVGEAREQVRWAFRWCFGRDPSDSEAVASAELITEHGAAALARALFNSSEFLYVD